MSPTRALFALAAVVALAGCKTLPERVLVPVAVPCKVDIPKPPVWATSLLAADATIWDQVKALLAERRQRQGFELELEAALKACRSTSEAPALDQ